MPAVHDRHQQIALRIYRDTAFAAFDFLAGVVATLPPFSAVFADGESRIATAWCGVSSLGPAALLAQHLAHALPHTVVAPDPKLLIHRLPGRKVVEHGPRIFLP
jgi:hypothetical protein